jgi:uncharacterized damage-inducible protein DinB
MGLETDFDKTIIYQDSRGRSILIELWHALSQRANHSTFHRGQIIAKIHQLGKVPPSTDFVVFCCESNKGF